MQVAEENQGNMAPGQQNAPEPGKTHYNPAEQSGEEILRGARNEDQLEQMKANSEGSDNPSGEKQPQ